MESTVGNSGLTPFKQADIQSLLKKQIAKCSRIYIRYHSDCWYSNVKYQNCFIDCTSGDMNLNKKTSPRTFIDVLRQFNYYPSNLFLIEKCTKTFKELEKNFTLLNERSEYKIMGSLFRDDMELIGQKDICKVPPQIKLLKLEMSKFLYDLPPEKNRYGLLYYDPNGFSKEDYESLYYFIENNPLMDIIININVVQIARNRGVSKVNGFEYYHNLNLLKIISKINEHKTHVFIRNNIKLEEYNNVKSTNKFVLLFGTNEKNPSLPKECDFVLFNSEQGQQIINKYNYGNKSN